MNFLEYILNSIFKKKNISEEVQAGKTENPSINPISPETYGFSVLIPVKSEIFEIFLN